MIKFGLLGCGRIAKRHSDLLGGHHVDQASLAGVCDPIRARADTIASKFGVPAYYDIDGFLARKEIDAVAVLTPSGMHPEHVIGCARTEKRVVVEKPMRWSFMTPTRSRRPPWHTKISARQFGGDGSLPRATTLLTAYLQQAWPPGSSPVWFL